MTIRVGRVVVQRPCSVCGVPTEWQEVHDEATRIPLCRPHLEERMALPCACSACGSLELTAHVETLGQWLCIPCMNARAKDLTETLREAVRAWGLAQMGRTA